MKLPSQELLKSPASIMESLIGAHSARKVFSEKKKKRERKESFLGEATITMHAAALWM